MYARYHPWPLWLKGVFFVRTALLRESMRAWRAWPLAVASADKFFEKPVYLARTGRSDCELLCEADTRCAAVMFQSSVCLVFGSDDAAGHAAVEGAESATYSGGTGNRSAGRVHLVTFASGERFVATQELLHQSLERAGIDNHWQWNGDSFTSRIHGEWFSRHNKSNFRVVAPGSPMSSGRRSERQTGVIGLSIMIPPSMCKLAFLLQ